MDESRPAAGLSAAVMANFAGAICSMIISILSVPFYLRYLGAEGYGVVGFSTTLLSIVTFLDGGLTLTVNREFARLSDSPDNIRQRRETLSAGTVLFALIALVVTAAIWSCAPWIARDWLNSSNISIGELVVSIRLIGFILGEQMLWALFQGALFGLHRQITANAVRIAGLTARAIGAVLILKYLSSTPSAFFAWYGSVLLAQILVARMLLARDVRTSDAFVLPSSRMLKLLLLQTRGFGALAILSLLLSQVDKLLISRMLPLQEFGYYMVAVSVSLLPLMIAAPFTNVFFPTLSRLAQARPAAAVTVFKLGTGLIGSIVVPVGFTLAMFSREMIFAWTGSATVTEHVAPIVTILIAGYSINGTLQLTYYFEMAHARTRIPIISNIIALLLIVPSMIALSRSFGALGVAGCWFLLNVGYLIIGMPILLRRSLGRRLLEFYIHSLLPPYGVTLIIVGLARILVPGGLSRIAGGIVTLAVLCLAMAACFLVLPRLRELVFRRGKIIYAAVFPRSDPGVNLN